MRICALALLTLAASPLAAQRPGTPPGQMRPNDMAAMHCGGDMPMHQMGGGPGRAGMPMHSDSMRGPMMEMMGPPTPAMILHHKEELKLSADQVARLENLQKQAEPACTQHMRMAMELHRAANAMLDDATPDFAAYTARLKEATSHMAEGHVAMAKAAVGARDVLTPAQRTSLKESMARMHK